MPSTQQAPTLLSFETNSLLQAADSEIAKVEYRRAKREVPWDGESCQSKACSSPSPAEAHSWGFPGYCGLVKVGEEEWAAGAPTVLNPQANGMTSASH